MIKMIKIKLNRIGDEVYYDDARLKVVKQASKGPGNESVFIGGITGEHGQQWIALKKLQEGEHEYECQSKKVTTAGGKLTDAERAEIAQLEAKIAEIKAAAKARSNAKPKLDVNPADMTTEEKLRKIEELKAYYGI